VVAAPNDLLLKNGDSADFGFDSQIAASHHHGVRNIQDVLQISDGLALFDLGDDDRLERRFVRRNQRFQLFDVGGPANEA